jgi:type IV pilus assembly protein PilE
MQEQHSGFTLLEMLTVLLIISVLSLIAYPNYVSYIYKTQRTDAMNSLFHYQALWQQCMFSTQDNMMCLQELGFNNSQSLASLQNHYQISALGDEFDVVLTARAIDRQADDKNCVVFSLDNKGIMLAYDENGIENNKECW